MLAASGAGAPSGSADGTAAASGASSTAVVTVAAPAASNARASAAGGVSGSRSARVLEDHKDLAAREPLLTGIARSRAEQAALHAERKRVAKELKRAEKRRRRIKSRACRLTDADLVAVLQMREERAAAAAADALAPVGASKAHAATSSAAARGAWSCLRHVRCA